MKRICAILLLLSVCIMSNAQENTRPTRTIFAYGGGFNKYFMRYVIALTKKQNPKI